ncbi:hypothetical protein OIO90_004902 [Microbotryomycetes sp. JL221]|nr:hypothetical protein OIO90_004902 [Microbotryomycetes sp. JL221]
MGATNGMRSYEATAHPLNESNHDGPLKPKLERNSSQSPRRWILNAFDMNCAGHQSPGLWKHSKDQSSQYNDLNYWIELCKILEQGKFNGIFIADVLGAYDVYNRDKQGENQGLSPAMRTGAQWGVSDPALLISACAAVTSHLTFGVTQSVTYEQPYTVARKFSTLDHLTKGRIAINVVTSYLDSAAKQYGLTEQVDHDERYERANEYMDVLYKLWESSWRDDAIVLDVERDVYAEPDRIRKIHHKGKYFNVEGPHIVEPSPQGSPVIFQAGSSSKGLEFAARHAEAVFMSGPSPQKIRVQVDALRALTEQQGRNPYDVKVLVKLLVIVAETDEQAKLKQKEYQKLSSKEGAKVLMGGWLGQDLGIYDEVSDLRQVGTKPVQAVARGYANLFPKVEKWTADELARHVALGGMGPIVVGSPSTVADGLQHWIDVADCDGFNLCYAITPGTFQDIVKYLVPELQKRGVHWLDYPKHESEPLKPVTARETLYELGQSKLKEEHYGSKFKWKAGQEIPPFLEPSDEAKSTHDRKRARTEKS